MDTTPIVSVIIPVYNAEAYLRQCLDSVAGQTLREIEIICVDDGSTDSSLEILREYAHKDPRFIVMTQENKNAGAARNRGLDTARGRYLSFLDADDFFEPDMLEKAYRSAEENRSDIVVFLSDNYIETLGVYRFIPFTVREDLLPEQCPFAGTDLRKNAFRALMGWAWDKLFAADFVRSHNLRFQEQRTTNDMLFVFSAIVAARRISIVDQVLAHQRKGGSGSLSVTREKSWDCFYRALLALRQQLKDWDLYGRFERDFINYSLHFSLWHLETLAWPTQEKLYRRLKEDWYADLGVAGKPRSYFYTDSEYNAMRRIMTMDYDRVYKRLDTQHRLLDENGVPIPPRVSFWVPCAQEEDALRQCLESLLAQSEPLLEILCTFTGAANGVLELLQSFEQRDYRLRLIPSGRDLLAEARGISFTIIGEADRIAPNLCRNLSQLADAQQLDAVVADCITFSDDDSGRFFEYRSCLQDPGSYGKLLDGAALVPLLSSGDPAPRAVLFRTESLRENTVLSDAGDPVSWDEPLKLRLLSEARRVQCVDEALYMRRCPPRPGTPRPGLAADLIVWLRHARSHGAAYARAYAAHQNTPLYRLGKGRNWLARKGAGLIRCIRDHGLRYTLALAASKLRR